jgi:hypothetical protein
MKLRKSTDISYTISDGVKKRYIVGYGGSQALSARPSGKDRLKKM